MLLSLLLHLHLDQVATTILPFNGIARLKGRFIQNKASSFPFNPHKYSHVYSTIISFIYYDVVFPMIC
jgi:hypothetical protein